MAQSAEQIDRIQTLKQAGYKLGKTEYYNPGGETWHDAVIYPDHKKTIYADDPTRKEGAYLTIDEQWVKAWEHFQKGRANP